MIEYINNWGGINKSPLQRIPNISYRLFAFKEVELNSPSLPVCCTVTQFYSTQFGKGIKSDLFLFLSMEKPDKHYLSQVIKVNINSDEPH